MKQRSIILLILVTILLAACGQTGRLYLPDHTEQQQKG